MAALLLAVAVWIGVRGYREAQLYPNLRVEAEPFRWPRGCPPQAYAYLQEVPKVCAVHHYRIRNATELGLLTTGKNTRWYRLGDDALLLACFRLGDDCEVRETVPGKFVRTGYRHDGQPSE